ncbi:MAG: outer membrane beta-barrel protein [Actinobacteria bacterium]|nr:outer membrane beta-barrel protein [Actinomycetota bacterium]
MIEKRIFFHAILLFVLISLAVPNEPGAGMLKKTGLMIGYNSTRIRSKEISDYALPRAGYGIGLFAEWMDRSVFSLLGRLQYVQRGFVQEQIETDVDGSFIQRVRAKSQLDYFEVPFLLKIQPLKLPINPYFVAGPRFDFLIFRKNGKYEFSKITVESRVAENFDDFGVGFILGGGMTTAKILHTQLSFELNFNLDITNSFSKVGTMTVRKNAVDFWLKVAL